VPLETHEASWHSDGHILEFNLNKSNVDVSLSSCPWEKDDGPCAVRTAPCVVEYFVKTFGLECNVGAAAAKPLMEIAWTLLGDPFDLDACQLWWIPSEDSAFASWLASR
jgi:hypothetical protein